MWVYNTGPVGQFGNLTFIFWNCFKWAYLNLGSCQSIFVRKHIPNWSFVETMIAWKLLSQQTISFFFFSFEIYFIPLLKFAILFVFSKKLNSAKKLLNFACNSCPLSTFGFIVLFIIAEQRYQFKLNILNCLILVGRKR